MKARHASVLEYLYVPIRDNVLHRIHQRTKELATTQLKAQARRHQREVWNFIVISIICHHYKR